MATKDRELTFAAALQDAYDTVNALGGVASTPEEEEYGRGLDEVLAAIEMMQASDRIKANMAIVEKLLAHLRRPFNGFDPNGSKT